MKRESVMAIKTECPSCGKDYRVKDELDGRKIRCKECGEPFQVQIAEVDDVWDDDYDDDRHSDNQSAAAAAKSMPRRSRRRSSVGSGDQPRRSSRRPAWMVPVGILGIVAGLGITGFGIWGFMEGHRRAMKATLVGVFMTAGALKWVFSHPDDE